jgi:putative endopeptidase
MSARAAGSTDEESWRRASLEPVRFDAKDLDWSIRPQDDLDAFVNARWRQANPVPPEHGCWDCFTILNELSLQQQACIADAALRGELGAGDEARIVADFWFSTFDESGAAQGVEALRNELACIDAIDSLDSLADWLRRGHARGCDTLFHIEARPDHDDPATLIACVTPRAPGLPDRDDYFDATPAAMRMRAARSACIGSLLGLGGIAASDAAPLASEILALEGELAAALPPRRTLARDIARLQHPLSPSQADRVAPLFSWSAFFGQSATHIERFSLALPDFHAELDRLLHDVPIRVWRAYLRSRVCEDAAPYLGSAWREAHEGFHGTAARGRRAAPPRWKRALHTINAYVGEAMGRLYAARHGSMLANTRVRELFDALRRAFAARLDKADWMSSATRREAREKLARLEAKVGYPEQWRDWSGLTTTRRSLYENVAQARAFVRRDHLRKSATPTDARAWSLTPQTVNARYDPQRNEVLIPAALLQPPLFAADGDAASIHGAIGAVVAHEMTHGFDDQGSRFDAAGRLRNWWRDEDRARFDARAARVADAIEHYARATGDSVDGQLTLGENIADFGGLAIAFDALEALLAAHALDEARHDGFDQRQRFFLAWAALWRQNLTAEEARLRARIDVHAPGDVRANAAAADLPGFSVAFGCQPGDAMARMNEDRCGIW